MEFADFYQATSHRTLRYAYGLTGDMQQAQDVTQEAYARAWQRWRQISAYDNIEAWVRLIVNRLVQDWWRHLRVRSRTRLDPPSPVDAPSEDSVMLAAALKQLPKAQSRALALYYLLDLPVAEIAAETGVSDNTVRSWLARGRAGLADRLRDEADAATVPSADHVAEAGRRRRRTHIVTTVTAAGLAVLVVLGVAVAVIRAKRPDHPVTPAPSGTSLRKVGAPVPIEGSQLRALITGGRAYIAAYDGERLRVTALDARSGRLLWTELVPGTHAREGGLPFLTAVADALALGDVTDIASLTNQITVLDAATGAARWSHQFHSDITSAEPGDSMMFTSAAALMVDAKSGVIQALDWRTGQTRWTLPGPGRPTQEYVTRTSGSADVSVDGPNPAIELPTFYRLEPGGALREYAAATGRATGRSWRGLPKAAERGPSFLFQGKFYLVTDTQLSTFDLGGDGPSVAYTAHAVVPGTQETQRLWHVRPCAGDAICLIDGGNPFEEQGRNPYEVVMVRSQGEPVTQGLSTDDFLFPIGTAVYLYHGEIFDDHLRDMKPAELVGTRTVGVDTNGKALLVLDPDREHRLEPHPIHLWTFDPATRAVVDVGELTAVAEMMSVGDQRLLAVTAQGAQLFAYAR